MAHRAHRAREYRVGEYKEKISKVKKYPKSRSAYELGVSSDAADMEILNDRDINEMIEYYPIIILSCKIQESMLYSDVGALSGKILVGSKKILVGQKTQLIQLILN
ncbi:hypothetical protein [Bartonella sp. B1099]|uniref:hypothetical protein n=1 Tax=Bartonella sp. B1099 TaxID=2911422 RepID=UPI0020C2FB18|nr:hypothetical protein [Bartonella sp. B1099]